MFLTKPVITKPLILYGAGDIGRRALEYFGAENIYCFADSSKAGTEYYGKRVLSLDELTNIHMDYEVLATITLSAFTLQDPLFKQRHIPCRQVWERITDIPFTEKPELALFKGSHKGERCFIIGNGPSLRAKDLTILNKNGVYCFGLNAIFCIYDKTPWRPTAYVAGDGQMLTEFGDQLLREPAEVIFLPEPECLLHPNELRQALSKNERVSFYNARTLPFDMKSNSSIVSANPACVVSRGPTVAFIAYQWAFYMGFKEIYLLGMDCHYNPLTTADTHDPKNHFHPQLTKSTVPADTGDRMIAYHTAAGQYAKAIDVKIYNATRGGMLEVFERVSFDNLF